MAQHAVCTMAARMNADTDDSDAAADELSRDNRAWMRSLGDRDADAAGELADELAKRALDVRDPEDVARLCSAIVARLNGSKSDDDEIAAVLDAVTCGPLGTPGARGDALRRETLVFPGGVAWGLDSRFHGPALRAASAEFLLASARRDAERAGPVVRVVAEAVAHPYSRETCLRAAADPASRRLRALVATFGPAAPSYITTAAEAKGVGEMEIKACGRRSREQERRELYRAAKRRSVRSRRAARLNTRPRVLRARLGGALRLAPRGRLRRESVVLPRVLTGSGGSAVAGGGGQLRRRTRAATGEARAPRRGPRAVAGGRGEPLRRSYGRRVVDRPRARPGRAPRRGLRPGATGRRPPAPRWRRLLPRRRLDGRAER